MTNPVEKEHLDIIEENWGERLGRHNYNTVEKDETEGSSTEYKTELKRLGLVAFWKVPGKDGVLVSHVESYSLDGSKSVRQKIGLVGDAQQYFKQNGYQDQATDEKVSVSGQETECINVDAGKFWDIINKERQ